MGCINGFAGEVPAAQMSITFGLTVMIAIQVPYLPVCFDNLVLNSVFVDLWTYIRMSY